MPMSLGDHMCSHGRAFWAVFRARLRVLLAYRTAAVAGLFCQVFWGILRTAMFAALFRSASKPQPLDLAQVTGYVWMTQALFRMMPMAPDPDVRVMIRSGLIAHDLVRPMHLFTLWLMRALANVVAPVALRAAPLLLLAVAVFGVRLPSSGFSMVGFAGALVLGFIVAALLQTLFTISMLWTISGDGVTRMAQVATFVFSGIVLPIPFFPDWAQPAIRALPFRAVLDTPIRIWVGDLAGEAAITAFLHQLGWIVGLWCIGRWLIAKSMRVVVVHGG
ncbi:MAG: ABC transporter permease [Deltaproteobacteria bacterium]|nr:ABC transporter permease [Deltaproteobacteria bacterium]